MKDLFSNHASIYATFRPVYPESLYQFIFQHLAQKGTAWDCATGNGQVAQYLCKHFTHVYATDISQQQLKEAYRADNITYSLSAAEHTPFGDNQFDLITVGQALHWLNHDKFFREVKRVGRPGAIFAAWGYSILSVSADIDHHVLNYYRNIVGPYWDSARRLVDEQYKSISLPIKEIKAPTFEITVSWTLDHLMGYLESWSATQKYIKSTGSTPLPALRNSIAEHWLEGEAKTVSFPLFLRMGQL